MSVKKWGNLADFLKGTGGDMMKALVILSGGMDSATVLGHVVSMTPEKDIVALTFDYGQRHAKEMEAAKMLTD